MADVPSLDLTAAAIERVRVASFEHPKATSATEWERRMTAILTEYAAAAALEAALPATPAEPERMREWCWDKDGIFYCTLPPHHVGPHLHVAAFPGYRPEPAVARRQPAAASAGGATGEPVCTSPDTDCTNDCPYRPACVAAGGEATAAEKALRLCRDALNEWGWTIDASGPGYRPSDVQAALDAIAAVLRPLPADGPSDG